MTELLRALAALIAGPGPGLGPVAAALELPLPTPVEHHALFGMGLHPYASLYLGPEGMLGGEARDRVAGFWRALGNPPPAEPDHLASLLGTLAVLAEDPAPAAAAARRVLLWEHVLSWTPAWLDRVHDLAAPSLRPWAELLHGVLLAEAEAGSPPETLPACLRLAAPFEPDQLVRHLLAPARAGMIITRADLARGARELGLGMRQGDRATSLRSLLTQDAPAVLRWLAGEAERAGERHRLAPDAWRPVTAWWSERALATARTLRGLEIEAKEVVHAG